MKQILEVGKSEKCIKVTELRDDAAREVTLEADDSTQDRSVTDTVFLFVSEVLWKQ